VPLYSIEVCYEAPNLEWAFKTRDAIRYLLEDSTMDDPDHGWARVNYDEPPKEQKPPGGRPLIEFLGLDPS
jgi:hypothetical protein